MAFSALIFFLVLGLLIFFHELGHFLMARLVGIKVEEFAFGFPPKIFSRQFGGTKYLINLIPIGGYVKLLGEEKSSRVSSSYSAKSVWQRLLVVLAGVLMNFILAIIVFTIGFTIGMVPFFSEPATLGPISNPIVYIIDVIDGSPAENSGLKIGDSIAGFDSAQAVQDFAKNNRGRQVTLNLIDQSNNLREVDVSLRDQDIAPLGVSLFETGKVKLPAHKAFIAGVKESTNAVKFTLDFIGQSFLKLFVKGEVPQEVGGPVAIFGLTKEAATQGLAAILRVIGILSVNLAIINIVPFPALDGGKAAFLITEGIFGRKIIKEKYESIIHAIGFAFLIMLIVAITYRDIIRLR